MSGSDRPPPHLADGGQEGARLVLMFEKLAFRYRVVDDAGGGLDGSSSIRDDAGADRDREVHAFGARRDVSDGPAVWTAPLRLQLGDELHRTDFGCGSEGAGGETCPEGVHRRQTLAQLAVHLAHEMEHMRI